MSSPSAHYATVVLVIGMAACLSGCLIAPHTRDVTTDIRGTVRDAGTDAAIPGAKIAAVLAEFHGGAVTNAHGEFDVGRLKQWHWLVYLGSPGIYPTPLFFRDDNRAPLELVVTAPGYESASQVIPPAGEFAEKKPPFDRPVDFKLTRVRSAAP